MRCPTLASRRRVGLTNSLRQLLACAPPLCLAGQSSKCGLPSVGRAYGRGERVRRRRGVGSWWRVEPYAVEQRGEKQGCARAGHYGRRPRPGEWGGACAGLSRVVLGECARHNPGDGGWG
jgi:hypothetical protein